INERVVAIGQISKNQLQIKAALDALDDRIPKGVVFTELDAEETGINQTIIKITGYAPDRSAINTLATKLGASIGTFVDVVPFYNDKAGNGAWTITCKHVGPVPPNPITQIQARPAAAPVIGGSR